MILIRGIKGESYARKIEKGVVDCRDLLSALLQPPVTGYEYSDYYEKNLAKALTYFLNEDISSIRKPNVLFSILSDYYIPHMYLTYFHVLNNRSLEWMNKFDDDYKFIAINPKIDRITNTVIGEGFFGARMSYVDNINEITQDGSKGFYAACMCSLEDYFEDKRDMNISLQIYNTLSFPLLCREQDDHFTDIENEFRIIVYDCPKIKKTERTQIPREVTILGKTGVEYKGELIAGENSVLKSNLCLLSNPYRSLKDILEDEQGEIIISSKFKSINIRSISEDFRYLGGKRECEEFINRMLERNPKDVYINRTVQKKYRIEDIPDAIYLPGFQRVEY